MVVYAQVDFSKKILDWDGFGFNYVETCQTRDYKERPQDYGGFGILSEEKRKEILELVFGENGLKPGVIKMFLDPFHQTETRVNDSALDAIDQNNYDHESTTKWMRYFVKNGIQMLKEQGILPRVVTTLYGPPAFMTKQKCFRGRDLDPKYKVELAKYFVAWAEYLREEGIPVEYLSLHNEGEDYIRWPADGSMEAGGSVYDYNMYWPPEQVVEMISIVADVIRARRLEKLYPTTGETTGWDRFDYWGYADAIVESEKALGDLGLLTSHGFVGGELGKGRIWVAARSGGIDKVHAKRPDLHCWTDSTSWYGMDAKFVYRMHELIYSCKNNAIIPWAGIQRPAEWMGNDPNPGTAIVVNEDGTYEVKDGYYYYKQLCPVAQPGMYVARTSATHRHVCVFAFAGNGTGNKDAFIVVNMMEDEDLEFEVKVLGKEGKKYSAYRTAAPVEYCKTIGEYVVADGKFMYAAPRNSVTTFVEME